MNYVFFIIKDERTSVVLKRLDRSVPKMVCVAQVLALPISIYFLQQF